MLKGSFARRLRTTVFLLTAFLFGAALSSTVLNAQYMGSEVQYCDAACATRGTAARCPDVCQWNKVPPGASCSCSCTADNLYGPANAECSSYCDFGTPYPIMCPE